MTQYIYPMLICQTYFRDGTILFSSMVPLKIFTNWALLKPCWVITHEQSFSVKDQYLCGPRLLWETWLTCYVWRVSLIQLVRKSKKQIQAASSLASLSIGGRENNIFKPFMYQQNKIFWRHARHIWLSQNITTHEYERYCFFVLQESFTRSFTDMPSTAWFIIDS